MNISRLADLVAIRLGEYPCRTVRAGELATDLATMIRTAAPEAAVRLTAEAAAASLRSLTATIDFRAYLKANIKKDAAGAWTLAMPADFLCLHTLRMTGWPAIPVENGRLRYTNPLRQTLGPAAPGWMANRPTLPWLECETRLDPDTGTSRSVLRLSPVETPEAESALYVPRPYLDDATDTLKNLDQSLILPLIEKLCADFNNL